MKKIILAITAIILTIFTGAAHAAPPDELTVKVNGTTIAFDAKPYIENNRTMVPIRFISEALGAKVDWNGTYKLVTITLNDTRIEQKIGKTVAIVNNHEVTFDVPAVIKNDRTMVPVRFVSEALGANVIWEESTRTVIITTKKIDPTSTPIIKPTTPTPVNTNPTVTEKYNPSKWVVVSEKNEDSELDLNIDWNDHDKFMANCDFAESVISKKYNADIAKRVIDIARKKTDRSIQFAEKLNYNGKKIDIYVWGSSIGIIFWKEGVD